MTQVVRKFLFLEVAIFSVAAFLHAGLLIDGYQHREARIAESVIASVLVFGLGLSWIRPAASRVTGLIAQAFALFGTLVGIVTIIVGIGPRTMPDIAYHVAIVAALAWGLIMVMRAPADDARRRVRS